MVEALIHILAGFSWAGHIFGVTAYVTSKAMSSDTFKERVVWGTFFWVHCFFTVYITMKLIEMLQANQP